jgi:hypothetical protein
MTHNSFYAALPSFPRFSQFTEDHYYHALPQDWYLVITDIKGSTKAIEAGRYKEVNLVGAAAIAAARSAMAGEDFPFVFGGDGASFAFHESHLNAVKEAMLGVKHISKTNYQLDLRVGVIPIAELSEQGAKIEIARYEIIQGRYLAAFRGGGLATADQMIKEHGSKYLISAPLNSSAQFEGLSCRWRPIPNLRGTVLSLIIQTRDPHTLVDYRQIIEAMDQLCGGQLENFNPVNLSKVTYQSIRECISQESNLHINKLSGKHLLRILGIVFCVCVFRLKLPALFFDPQKYVKSMRTHADYRKFDDALRMVIDVSVEHNAAILDYLEELYQQGQIFYGSHESQDSLMTCYVDDINDGDHIHFIDGADGGYAMATKQLKRQIKEAEMT